MWGLASAQGHVGTASRAGDRPCARQSPTLNPEPSGPADLHSLSLKRSSPCTSPAIAMGMAVTTRGVTASTAGAGSILQPTASGNGLSLLVSLPPAPESKLQDTSLYSVYWDLLNVCGVWPSLHGLYWEPGRDGSQPETQYASVTSLLPTHGQEAPFPLINALAEGTMQRHAHTSHVTHDKALDKNTLCTCKEHTPRGRLYPSSCAHFSNSHHEGAEGLKRYR
ncbi:hypothetical protein EYF80_052744 [Liparis tanakae]|uniref:Uncharacterized protein n=1 Tax=Liparis tanakae TaxID=230148 RepID=A0A4Z2F9S7_9TELE|nr:hypothetical protein EYF80_052744 [Liparis tanakae]